MRNKGILLAGLLAATVALVQANGTEVSDWSPPVNVESIPGTSADFNTAANDGCPAPSPDGLALYMASNRPGSQGLDIWVSRRGRPGDPWGPPQNLGAPINTAANEFCPTPLPGNRLMFVSTKPGCGGSDIYIAHEDKRGGWQEPYHLGCSVNSAQDEASPIIVRDEDGTSELYFSSTRLGGFAADAPGAAAGDSDIYVSLVRWDGSIATPALASGLNTEFQDARPNLRRDGLEIVFDSDRPGSAGFDIWSALRRRTSSGWDEPFNVFEVNSSGGETRAFLSPDARTLYFGSNRPGAEPPTDPGAPVAADIYASTRRKHAR